jgi:hypothetical protein
MASYKPKQSNEKALQKFLKSKSNADKKSTSRGRRGSSSK